MTTAYEAALMAGMDEDTARLYAETIDRIELRHLRAGLSAGLAASALMRIDYSHDEWNTLQSAANLCQEISTRILEGFGVTR